MTELYRYQENPYSDEFSICSIELKTFSIIKNTKCGGMDFII
jgi:hypothetical protein